MHVERMTITIPTYDPETQECNEAQRHKLHLRSETGLRVIFGDPLDRQAPDVLIERHPEGWQILVHPTGDDPLCVIRIGKTEARIDAEDPNIKEPLLTVPLVR